MLKLLVEKLGLSEGAATAVLWVGLSVLLLVVVGLLALWLVRTLRPSLNINGNGRGGRPQRLAITDAFPLDRDGRKLVIVRRDNTEHLLLIGGPNDLLVEGNITRHDRSSRGMARGGMEAEGEESAAIPAPMPSVMVAPQAPQPMGSSPISAPPISAPLRNEEFDRALAAQRVVVAPPQPVPPRPAPAPVFTAPVAPTPVITAPVAAAPEIPAPEPATAPPPAPPVLTLEALLPEAVAVVEHVAPPPPPPVESPVAPEPAPVPVAPAARAPAMSEMARRLNEALQKPMSGTLRPPFNRSIPPAPPTPAVSAPPVVAAPVVPPPAPEPRVVAPEPEQAAKADMDLLEEEMARLLGRPAQPKIPDPAKKSDAS